MKILIVASLFAVVLSGCVKKESGPSGTPPGKMNAKTRKGYPTIDCPYAVGGGVDRFTPFKDTAEYIKHLNQPKRLKWKKHHVVISALHLKGDEVITDLGAGAGSFALRFARVLPKGHVHALDILPGMISYMKTKAKEQHLTNITISLTHPDKPTLGPGTTLAFVNNVLHFVRRPGSWIAHIASQLPKGGRLVIIDFKMGKLPLGPPDSHKVSPERLKAFAKAAGLTLSTEDHRLLPYQHLVVFTK
ncbi:class I SAM-dependent methyltransferase [Myxococcota bacterium]|nr:class I SAM-dependent methyltransferase [Myxococcota bacterium]